MEFGGRWFSNKVDGFCFVSKSRGRRASCNSLKTLLVAEKFMEICFKDRSSLGHL
jgi:hypothetical protein